MAGPVSVNLKGLSAAGRSSPREEFALIGEPEGHIKKGQAVLREPAVARLGHLESWCHDWLVETVCEQHMAVYFILIAPDIIIYLLIIRKKQAKNLVTDDW